MKVVLVWTKIIILLEDKPQAHCCRYLSSGAQVRRSIVKMVVDNIGIMEVRVHHTRSVGSCSPWQFPIYLLHNFYMISDARSSYFVEMGSTRVSNSAYCKRWKLVSYSLFLYLQKFSLSFWKVFLIVSFSALTLRLKYSHE